jgi:hypothetical protein
MSSPTQRSLKHLRTAGYTADVVEKWIPGANIRRDLFGFIDILAIRDTEIVGVQATSGSNVSSRVTKITEHDNLAAVRKAGIRVLVHGWTKCKGRWAVREIDLS